MKTNNKITDISAELAREFGEHGTPQRAEFDEQAYAFYTSQILRDARRDARLTQSELAERLGVNKSYVSRVENGITSPSVAMFYRIANALGLRVELQPVQ